MKKIGYFFSGFLPILTTTAAQILASFFMFGIAALFLCPASQSTGFDADTIETLLTNTEFNACIMLIYTVTCIVFMGIWYYRSCGGNYLPKPSLTFHPLQFLSIILLIPGMQFFSGYLTSAVSLLFPNWLIEGRARGHGRDEREAHAHALQGAHELRRQAHQQRASAAGEQEERPLMCTGSL